MKDSRAIFAPPSTSSAKIRLGRQGERIALDYVISKGYLVVETNWRSGRTGEIDMILKSPEKDLFVFVEVKTRRSTGHGAPIESVSLEKQSRMMALSEQYVQANPEAQKAQRRFDIIGVLMPGAESEATQIIHLENAFP